MITLTPGMLTLAQLRQIAQENVSLRLDPDFLARRRSRGRRVVRQDVNGIGRRVYDAEAPLAVQKLLLDVVDVKLPTEDAILRET
jgi:hypothetical protein